MTWRPMTEAPKTDEPVLLKAGEDIGTAFLRDDEWFFFDIEITENIRYGQVPDGWLPYPRNAEEAAQLVSEAEALAREPERELAALVAHRDSIRAQIDALDAAEQAEQRRAEQRAADERDHEAEQERLRQVRSLLPGGDA